MKESKISFNISARSCALYSALYLMSLSICFIGGYFLGVSRSIRVWTQQQVLDQEHFLQKTNTICTQQISQAEMPLAESTQPIKGYKALVIGGTKSVVESFVEAMQQKNITLNIEQRVSKTKKGKEYCWYQATTPILHNKEELQKLVEVLKKYGKLKDVQIIQYS